MLAALGIGVRFDGSWVLRDVDLECAAGEVVAVVGRNGAGKTTLLRAVAGVLPIDRGTITLGGAPLVAALRRRVGFVPEAADAPGFLTSRDLLALSAALRASPPLPEALRRRIYPAELERARIATLSLGERRRVCLAAALVGDPALLILDEPENGLDASGVELLIELLTEARVRGAAVLLVSHDPALRRALGCREFQLAADELCAAGG
jgi:ABC-2 type transport system ATP-binding protein